MAYVVLIVALAVISAQIVIAVKLVKELMDKGITFIDVYLLLLTLVTMINLIVQTVQLYIVT